ncbi:protein phosphatase 2C domain-containing protein [Streptomyces sp. NPDC046853]|uniref:protein phosphatase 2C domain-containing protein n=1 Tax=Streptomyces sp. NPDC046853 TaxID=3154920 RepID=UPI0034100CF4
MSQQGERHDGASGQEDDWWGQLYDDSAHDTGPAEVADSLDDRFASAAAAAGGSAADPSLAGGDAGDPSLAGEDAGAPAPADEDAEVTFPRPGRFPAPEPPPPDLRDRRGVPDATRDRTPRTPGPAAPGEPPGRDAGAAHGGPSTPGEPPPPPDLRDRRGTPDATRDLTPRTPDPVAPGEPPVRDAGVARSGPSTQGEPPPPDLRDRRGAPEAPRGLTPRMPGPTAPGEPPGRDAGAAHGGPSTPGEPPPPPDLRDRRGTPGATRDLTPRTSDPAAPGGPPPPPPAPASPPHEPPTAARVRQETAPWEASGAPSGPVSFPAGPPSKALGDPSRTTAVPAPRSPEESAVPDPQSPAPAEREPSVTAAPVDAVPYVGDGPPTYDAEPTVLPAADPDDLGDLVADTVLDGARYGTSTLRAVSVRGDSARYRGEPRRDSLLTARFGTGESALVLVAMATGARATPGAHRAAAEACAWIGRAVGRSHQRLSEDIRAARRGDLKSGLHRLTDRSLGKLRAHAADLGIEPEEYAASLRCLLLPADPECRTRVFFGVGSGGLFRLRDGAWQDIEPRVSDTAGDTGPPVVGFGSVPPQTPEGDRLTMDMGIITPPSPYEPAPEPPPREPFRFRASVARPGDALLLCSGGLAEPLSGEPEFAAHLTQRWAKSGPPGLVGFLADIQVRVKGYADDRTAAAVWEA